MRFFSLFSSSKKADYNANPSGNTLRRPSVPNNLPNARQPPYGASPYTNLHYDNPYGQAPPVNTIPVEPPYGPSPYANPHYDNGYGQAPPVNTVRVEPPQQHFDPRSTFWEPGSSLPPPRYNAGDILIAVMGMTGAGKTSFISKLAGVQMEIGHGLLSCTKTIGIVTMQYHGQRIHLIDTPGFDDTNLKDAEILERIALYLTGTPDRRVRLSGIIYLHRISDFRVAGTALKNIRMFRGLVGSRSMKNVTLVTTMWGLVNPKDGETRMQQLMETDDFFGQMIRSGATCDKYNNTRRDGSRILKALLPNPPCTLQIQSEMEKGVQLADTTAGREVTEQLEKLKAEHKMEMAKMKKDMEQAQRERDDARYKSMQLEYQSALQKAEEARVAQQRLTQATIQSLQAQVEAQQSSSWCVVM